jgi:serine phosphatase RsbU (regulator of sigma subunit)/anti-sigma regulatory factor (Ser/Thr protein kinase)
MERLILPAKLYNLEKMFDFIRAAAVKQGFEKSMVNKIQLACEEALVNVINYAYPEQEGDVEITYDNLEEALEIEIVDSGVAFDPLALPAPDITAPIEKRRIGGLGIYMLRKIMDKVTYKREEGRNILNLIKYSNTKADYTGSMKDSESPSKPQGPNDECCCCFRWPLDFMKKEEFKKGDVIFKAGDKADKMYYIKKGVIKLLEINKSVKEGDVIGEMGIFSPFKERTASAVCEEDLETYTMGKDEVMKFFGQDPNLAIELIQMSVKRFIENLRAETAARERIESELRIAQQIQASMLPSVFPQKKEFDIFAMMVPAKEVGGDFYDFFFIDENRLCFVIGDVSGKGVPAALFMAISKTLIKTEAMRGLAADQILERVNSILCPDNQTCLFVTVFCSILDIRTGQVEYSNGGHNPPVIMRANGEIDFINVPSGFVVGVMENVKCEINRMILNPNDTIFLYTDGVTEAMNPQRKLFSEEKLKSCLVNFKDKEIKDIIKLLRQEISSYAKGEPQSDDITMLAVKFKG